MSEANVPVKSADRMTTAVELVASLATLAGAVGLYLTIVALVLAWEMVLPVVGLLYLLGYLK